MDNKIKILHLEDSLVDSHLIRTYLADGDFSYDYFLADNKNDFVTILEKETIDIILSDFSLPDFDGNQALGIAREKYPNTPFIFVSGVMGENDAISALHNGAMDYVLKSNPARLVPAIKRATHEHQLEQELITAHIDRIYREAETVKQAEELVLANRLLVIEILEKEQQSLELIHARKKAGESDLLKSAFLANMSHEIRTPMNGILGFAVLLMEPGLTGEKQLEYIRTIEKSGTRMLDIINNIVEISKIDSGLMITEFRQLDIARKVESIYHQFKAEAETKDILLSIGKQLPRVDAVAKTDPEKLASILTHLVNNAIKFTPKGSIELGYEKKGEYIEFYIKDTGIGIPPERQQAIFERFAQAEMSNQRIFQGAGLGLSISKAYVEMLGGKLWVDSEVGKGSVFSFNIPCG